MVEKKKIVDKRFIPTLISLAILVIIVAIAYPMFFGKPNVVPNDDGLKSFLDFKPSEVNYIVVKTPSNKSLDFTLELKNKNWYVNGEEAYNPQIAEIMTVLSSVKIKDKVEDSSYLPQFQLDTPVKIITIGFKDPKKEKLSVAVGAYAPVSNDIYAKYTLKPDVYMVDKFLLSGVAINPQGLWNRDIFKIDPDSLKEIIVTRQDKSKYEFNLKKDGWFVLMPNGKDVKADEDIIIGIVNNLFGNQGDALIAKNATDLKKYKLNDPIMTVEAIDKNDISSTVIVSSIVASTQIHYIMNTTTRDVYIINKNKLASLYFNDVDVRNKKLLVPHLYDFEKVVIKIGDKEYTFSKNRKKIWDAYNLDRPIELKHQYIENLSTFYVDGITFEEIDKVKEKTGFDKPQITITVYEKPKMDKKGYKPFQAIIGNKAKGNMYYLQLSNDPYLYKLAAPTVKYIKALGEKKQQ